MNPIKQVAHLPRESGVYEIRNTLDGKVYVGSSVNIRQRAVGHVWLLNRGTHHGKKLLNAWRKHGSANFKFQVVELCPVEALADREAFWLERMNVFKHGYNTFALTPTGRGYKQSADHVERRVSKQRGKPLPEATKLAVAEANKSRVWTEEQRKDAAERLKRGREGMSKADFKERLSSSMRGRVLTQEHKDKLSKAKTGQTWRDKPGGEERAAAIGDKMRGRKITEKEKTKRSASQKRVWNSPDKKQVASDRVKLGWKTRKANRLAIDNSPLPPSGKD